MALSLGDKINLTQKVAAVVAADEPTGSS